MNRLILISLLTFVSVFGQNPKSDFEISGKVKVFIGNEWIEIKNATVELLQNRDVCDLDSLGNYKFTGLKSGSYELRVLDFNSDPKIFHIELLGQSIDKFDLYIDVDCEVNKLIAEKDIKKGKPKLLLIGGIAPIHHVGQEKIEKKFTFKYYDFGCTPPPIECVIQYNNVIFDYLDKKFNKNWRKDVRKDVIGLN